MALYVLYYTTMVSRIGIYTLYPVWALVINGINHWYYIELTRSKIDPWPGVTKSYLWQPVIASPVNYPTNKDGRATDSCFAHIGSVLMVDV